MHFHNVCGRIRTRGCIQGFRRQEWWSTLMAQEQFSSTPNRSGYSPRPRLCRFFQFRKNLSGNGRGSPTRPGRSRASSTFDLARIMSLADIVLRTGHLAASADRRVRRRRPASGGGPHVLHEGQRQSAAFVPARRRVLVDVGLAPVNAAAIHVARRPVRHAAPAADQDRGARRRDEDNDQGCSASRRMQLNKLISCMILLLGQSTRFQKGCTRRDRSYAAAARLVTCRAKKIIAQFDGGLLSSDAGVLVLREVEQRLRVAERLAALRARKNPASRHLSGGG